MSKPKNLIGEKFGKLTVVERRKNSKSGKAMWLCECECGNKVIIPTYRLTMGETRSCGCLKKESKNFTHKMSKTRIYYIWLDMKKRCHDQKNKSFKHYGGKGITVCEEWEKDFMSFFKWAMENGYSEELTIDRINGELGYSPENCRWANKITQNNNRKNSLFVEYMGETKTLSEWCRQYERNYKMVYQRFRKLGWQFEKAMFTPKTK